MITQKELWDIIDYDISTGIITWKNQMPGTKAKAGEEAGTISCGYRRIQIAGKRYMSHVLAWIYIMGEAPKFHIDHKDGNTLNNSFENLREADSKQNARNRKIHKNNKTKHKGVCFHKGQQMYHATLNGIHLGSFVNEDEAVSVVELKRKLMHGSFAKTR